MLLVTDIGIALGQKAEIAGGFGVSFVTDGYDNEEIRVESCKILSSRKKARTDERMCE
jgi:hypothetical protein